MCASGRMLASAYTCLSMCLPVLPNRRAACSSVRAITFLPIPVCTFICLPVLPDRWAACSPACALTCLPICAYMCLPVLPDRRAHGRQCVCVSQCQIAGPHACQCAHLLASQFAPSFVSQCCQICLSVLPDLLAHSLPTSAHKSARCRRTSVPPVGAQECSLLAHHRSKCRRTKCFLLAHKRVHCRRARAFQEENDLGRSPRRHTFDDGLTCVVHNCVLTICLGSTLV